MPTYIKDAEVVANLSAERFRVTQENGTEPPGTGDLLDNKEPGIYVDIVSGEPSFASTNKYESGCGWPSFTKPIDAVNVAERIDTSHGMTRTRCAPATATATLEMCSPTARRIEVAFAIASTQRPYASSIGITW